MKKKLLLTILLLLPFLSTSWAQCEEDESPRIFLLGDSWAFFMNADGTFNNVLDHWGHSDKVFFTNPDLSVSGARTEDFLTMTRLAEIQNQLDAHPSIEAVHISLSGNDFLGAWTVDFTEEETEELSDETYEEITELIEFIREARPGIQIVISGYMYANFAEVIADAEPFEESHPFYGNWEEMGFPTFEQLNVLLNGFSDRMEILSLSDPDMDYVNVPALMQYVYGQEEPLGVFPGGTYAPLSQPLPYGDITYPSPKESMRDYGLVRDCFHLSEEGFFYMIDYQFQKFYHKFLMDDGYVIAEAGSENGSVSAVGDVDAGLRIGETDAVESKVILSFDMSDIPDTVFTGASLFLRRESLSGINPLGATAILTMASGNLGSSVDVDTDDFSDEGDIVATACVFGMNDVDDNWLRIELPEEFLPFISSESQMQFSIAVPELGVGELLFTDGTDPEFAPVLNLEYKSEFVGIEEEQFAKSDLILFPNPVKDHLTLFSQEVQTFDLIEIINLQGQVVFTQTAVSEQLNISDLSPGNYILRASTSSGVMVKSFIKQGR